MTDHDDRAAAARPAAAPSDRRARVRPWRAYLWLAVVDVLIVGALAAVALTSTERLTLGELGPVATSLTALVGLNVGVVTVAQKRVADAREAWWARAQWALERSLEDSVRARAVGQLTLAHLVHSDLVTADDLALIEAIPDAVVAKVEEVDTEEVRVETVDEGPEYGAARAADPTHEGPGLDTPDTMEIDVVTDADP